MISFLEPDESSAPDDVLGVSPIWIILEKNENLISKMKNKTLISTEFKIFFDRIYRIDSESPRYLRYLFR